MSNRTISGVIGLLAVVFPSENRRMSFGVGSKMTNRASVLLLLLAISTSAAEPKNQSASPAVASEDAKLADQLNSFSDLRQITIEAPILKPASWSIWPQENMTEVANRLEKAHFRGKLEAIDGLSTTLKGVIGVESVGSIAALAKAANVAWHEGHLSWFAIPHNKYALLVLLTPFGQYTHFTNADDSKLWLDVAVKENDVSWRVLAPGIVGQTVNSSVSDAIGQQLNEWAISYPGIGIGRLRPEVREAESVIVITAKHGDVLAKNVLEAINGATDVMFGQPGVDRALIKSLVTPDVRSIEVEDGRWIGRLVVPSDISTRPPRLIIPDRDTIETSLSHTPSAKGVLARDRKSALVVGPLVLRRYGKSLDFKLVAAQLAQDMQPLKEKFGSDATFSSAVIVRNIRTLNLNCDSRVAGCI